MKIIDISIIVGVLETDPKALDGRLGKLKT